MKRAAVMAGLAALVSAACSSGGTSPAAWNTAASSALSSFGQRAALVGPQEQQWEAGTITTPAFLADLAQTRSVMGATMPTLERLPEYPGQPFVDRMYEASVSLYAVQSSIQLYATSLPAGPLRTQILRISDRVRELADRVFDQGRVLTAQGLVPAGAPAGAQIELPLEVPNWVAEGLAAGPPLGPTPAPADRFPPLRQGTRPTESPSNWDRTVRADGAPARAELQALTSAGSPAAALGAEAGRLQGAVDRLFGSPDPAVTHGREQSDRLRLALLIEAEACRVSQAADLVPAQVTTVPSDLSSLSPALLSVAAQIVATVTAAPS